MHPPRAALALSVLLVLSGCLGFGGPPPSEPGAEAVVDEAATQSSAIETYRFSHDISIVATNGDETRRVQVDVHGAVNRTAQRFRGETEYRGQSRATYVDSNKAYTDCEPPWGWGVENVSEANDGDWSNIDPLGRQVALLEASPVYWAGNETIDGVSVHVVDARPSGDTLERFADRQETSVLGPSIEDATLTAYITEDGGRIVKTVLKFTVSESGGEADATMTTFVEDVGANVTITIPDEATEDPHELGCPGS